MNEPYSFIEIMMHARLDLEEVQKQGKLRLPNQPAATIDAPHKGGYESRPDKQWVDCFHLRQELPPNNKTIVEFLDAIKSTVIKDKDGGIILQKSPGLKTEGSSKDIPKIKKWVSNL